jgi:hypothetical protein
MTRITGEIVIDAPAEVVFDFVADQRNEPAYNPHMVRSAKVTPGPVGKGTQFRSAVRSGGRLAEMAIESTGFQRYLGWPRPRGWLRPSLAGRSRSSRLALARGCGGHGTPGSPGRCGCWHRSSPGWAYGRNERHGQGSSGSWSPPRARRAPAPGSSPAPHPPRLRTRTAARPPGQGRAGAALQAASLAGVALAPLAHV